IEEYRQLLAAGRAAGRADGPADRIEHALARLRPGDVVMLEKGRHAGRAVVLTVAQRKNSTTRVRVMTPHRVQLPLSTPDFEAPPRVVGHVTLPTPFAPNRQAFQRELARTLDRAKLTPRRDGGERRTRAAQDALG